MKLASLHLSLTPFVVLCATFPHPSDKRHLLRRMTSSWSFITSPSLSTWQSSLLFTGFFSLLRLDKLIQSDNWTLQTSAHLSWRHAVRLEVNLYLFTIPHSITNSFFEGNEIVIQKCAAKPDPFILFQRYLNSHDMSFPLFPSLWLCSDSSVPTHSWFLHRLYLFFPRSIGGHSMCADGATSLAAAGVPPSQIQAIGRWKLDTFEWYIWHHPTLLQAVLFHGRSVHEPPFAVPP